MSFDLSMAFILLTIEISIDLWVGLGLGWFRIWFGSGVVSLGFGLVWVGWFGLAGWFGLGLGFGLGWAIGFGLGLLLGLG